MCDRVRGLRMKIWGRLVITRVKQQKQLVGSVWDMSSHLLNVPKFDYRYVKGRCHKLGTKESWEEKTEYQQMKTQPNWPQVREMKLILIWLDSITLSKQIGKSITYLLTNTRLCLLLVLSSLDQKAGTVTRGPSWCIMTFV